MKTHNGYKYLTKAEPLRFKICSGLGIREAFIIFPATLASTGTNRKLLALFIITLAHNRLMPTCSNSTTDTKLQTLSENSGFKNLETENQVFIMEKTVELSLTQQDMFNLIEMTTDFEMWDVGSLKDLWNEEGSERLQGKKRKQFLMNRLKQRWQQFKT